MRTDIPPIAKSQRSGLLDETVLNFSAKLFENPFFGVIIAIIFNIFYIYYWIKHLNLISIIFFSLLYFILIRMLQIKILNW